MRPWQRKALGSEGPSGAHHQQLDLFSAVLHAYSAEASGTLDNADLYRRAADGAGIDPAVLDERAAIGRSGQVHNLTTRRIRWYQQDLRRAGILEHVAGERGVWKLTQPAGKDLHSIGPTVSVVGFSTELGVAILGACENVFAAIDAPISLVVTSPPYPLAKPRAYGNVPEAQYVDWICRTIEPVVRNLVPGGSICLNVSNDVFEPGLPSRSLYRERLLLALHDRLGLHKVDELIWWNSTKPPGPVQWASIERVQLNTAWEPIYWLTNDPKRLRTDNRRVLQAHTERHLRLIHSGGEQQARQSSDGAYTLRPGSYGKPTPGRIPRNVLPFAHSCADQREYRRMARAAGLPVHGATMPLRLASFLVEFMSSPGDLVVDPFAGSFTTARAAERLGRRWLATEVMAEYVLGAGSRFLGAPGYRMHLAA